ncbi:peroxidase 16-like [Phragmites australis]|uniref:peroxidase 16-like n=1 Tax=Phragmites australis TaxID=29695 RepID=UPI002D77CEF6|nr:peroxidase 16-like [Phragmites australis]
MARAHRSGGLLLRGAAFLTVAVLSGIIGAARAQLRQNFYASSCPSAESTVRSVISQHLQQSFAVGPGTLRLFFHDCFVRGCDASVMLMAPNGDDESHSGADATLSPDAVDAINKAKATVEALPGCAGKVSCADILAMAARDVVSLLGGPNYAVELGRLDGKTFNRAIVKHVLPSPGFNLNQLNSLFAQNGLTQTDMIALSGAHTIGVTHCDKFIRRIYTFKQRLPWNPPMNLEYLRSLRRVCPINYGPTAFAMLDVSTPRVFDNAYFNNLRYNKGLLASDQVLFTDSRSRPTVNLFAANNTAFQEAFVAAMAKLGRIGIKTGSDGEVRRVCTAVN